MDFKETKDIIKGLRKQHDLSAQYVAEKCGLSLGVYKAYESGQRNIGVKPLGKIADFYGVSVDYLLGRSPAQSHTTVARISKDKTITADEFAKIYQELSPDGQELLIKMMEFMINENKKKGISKRATRPHIPTIADSADDDENIWKNGTRVLN